MSLSQEPQARDGSRHGATQVERGFTAAFELVATPALFALFGWFLDSRLGTGPFLTIGLATFVAGYLVWKLLYNYNAEMTRLESDLIRDRTGASSAVDTKAES
jgi:F0F1-type ATP synthase assembly protein I